MVLQLAGTARARASLVNMLSVLCAPGSFSKRAQLFDNKIALVSSYNFDVYSASKNWEAGLVTINPKVVSEIIQSINQLIEN